MIKKMKTTEIYQHQLKIAYPYVRLARFIATDETRQKWEVVRL
jgi:hypothetical protein